MSSIIDASNDAFSEKLSFVKIAIYSIPVYFCVQLFLSGKMNLLYFWGTVTGLLLFTVLTIGINNVRENNQEILTLNPLRIAITFIKTVAAVLPHLLFWGVIADIITKNVSLPIDLPQVDMIFEIVVWSVAVSLILTAYLSYAKYLDIKDAFNFKIIFLSCVDVLAALIFFVPQILLVNLVIVGPFTYLFWLFHVPFDNWGYVVCCSLAFVANISITANYFAQVSYEYIVLSNDRKDDYQITKLVETMDNEKN